MGLSYIQMKTKILRCDEFSVCLLTCLSVCLCISFTLLQSTIKLPVVIMRIKANDNKTLTVAVNITTVTTVRTMAVTDRIVGDVIWGERSVGRNGDVSLSVSQGRHVVMYFEVSVAMCPLTR